MVARPRILSRSNTVEESEDEEALVGRSDVERKLNLRRILMLLAIVLVVLVAASILLFFVANEIKRQEEFRLLEDIVCAPNDVACIAKLCPTGMTWQPKESHCVEQDRAIVGHLCLVSTCDTARCDPGYVWVSHKLKCMRIAHAG